MATPISSFISPDVAGFLLPFIFTFAIVYGLLIKANIFGDKANDRVSIALAFVIGIIVAAAAGRQIGEFLARLFGGASVFLAGILVIILFITMIGYKTSDKPNAIALAILVLLGVLLFLAANGNIPGFRLDQSTASLIFWAVVVLAVIYFIAFGPSANGKPAAAAPAHG